MYSSLITFVAALVASAYAAVITSVSNFPSQTGFPIHRHVTRTAFETITGLAPSHVAASVHNVAIKPTTGPAPEFAGHVTVNITNKHTASLSVAVTSDPSAPSASGDPQPSLLGDSTQFLFEKGFSGLIGVAPQLDSAATKIELSYDKSVYADVSYVDGYTVPITCSCDKETVYMGCNIELWNTNQTCPDEGDGPICYNPAAAIVHGPAHPFFEPCQGAAYTFPADDYATRACKSSIISCCVGADCPANPRQFDQGLGEHGKQNHGI